MNIIDVDQTLINSVMDFPDEHRSKILKMALIAYQPIPQDRSKVIEHFSKDTEIPKEQLYKILGVYIALLRLFLENSDTEFINRLKELRFSTDFIGKLPLIENREEIITNLRKNVNDSFGKLSAIRWKIDISLSNSSLVKKAPIPVILCITLKNGKKYTVEVDGKLFHKLRFNVALILKEMNILKTNYSNK